jgi:hypothetical protein
MRDVAADREDATMISMLRGALAVLSGTGLNAAACADLAVRGRFASGALPPPALGAVTRAAPA